MGTADKIVHEYRVSKRRFDAAISAVELLSVEQRKQLVAVLLERLDTGACRAAAPSKPASHRPAVTRGPKGWKTDQAEALVRERPGMTSAEIGALIQQARPAADSTLRQVQERRGSVERREGRWYPVTKPGGSPPSSN